MVLPNADSDAPGDDDWGGGDFEEGAEDEEDGGWLDAGAGCKGAVYFVCTTEEATTFFGGSTYKIALRVIFPHVH